MVHLDFIGIGSGKSGSTWLWENLVEHPEIYSGNAKEINYFHTGYLYRKVDWSWYQNQFKTAKPGQKVGEFSIVYMYCAESAALIKKHCPDVKILAILRDPIERTYSDYFHSIRKNETSRNTSFSEYIDSEMNLKFGQYYIYLQPYEELFGISNMHIMLLEEFTAHPESSFQTLFSFLGVDSGFVPSKLNERINQARFYRSLLIERAMTGFSKTLNNRGYTKFIERLKRLGVSDAIRRFNEKHREKPKMNDAEHKHLSDFFRLSNEALIDKFNLQIQDYWAH